MTLRRKPSMTKIKVSEATNIQLAWMVIVAGKGKGDIKNFLAGYCDYGMYHYATDWSQGGPIIEREKIGIVPMADGWEAQFEDERIGKVSYGPTYLIAAMRCYVMAKLGEEVEVPDELV